MIKKSYYVIFLLAVFFGFINVHSQEKGDLEVGQFFNQSSLKFSGNRQYFKTNKIYYQFTMYDGINGKIGTDYCKIEVEKIGENNLEIPVYSEKYEIDREWYTTWTSIELPNGIYRLRLYDGDGVLLGKSVIFTVNK